jgi:hypothetical protein
VDWLLIISEQVSWAKPVKFVTNQRLLGTDITVDIGSLPTFSGASLYHEVWLMKWVISVTLRPVYLHGKGLHNPWKGGWIVSLESTIKRITVLTALDTQFPRCPSRSLITILAGLLYSSMFVYLWSKIHLEQPVVEEIVKKFLALYGNLKILLFLTKIHPKFSFSQTKIIRHLSSYFLGIFFNIIISSMPSPSKLSSFFRLFCQNFLCFHILFHDLYERSKSHPDWCEYL